MRLINTNSKSSLSEQYKTTRYAFGLEVSNLVASLVAAIAASSVYVWIDTSQSLVSTLRPFLIMLVLHSLIKDDKQDKYNYGTERIECVCGIAVNVMNISCLVITLLFSILDVINPSQPSNAILGFILLKTLNCASDIGLFYRQSKIAESAESAISDAELREYRSNTYYDLLIYVIGIISYFFRIYPWSWYISPIASIFICIYILYDSIKQTIRFVNELSDLSISIDEQIRIFDIVMDKGRTILKSINSVNTHSFGNTVYVDIDVDFKDEINCGKEAAWLKEVSEEVHKDSTTKYNITIVHPDKKNI